ncbi:MAG: PadR family transcriptional regulator [Steroidobacteraceae bacterium]
MNEESKLGALRKGFLEFLVLRIISGSTVYAADILKKLAATDFATQEGTLYPLLSRMRREGLLDYQWQESEAGPPRKYYRLTGAGEQQLAEFTAYWARLSQTIDSMGS